LTDELDDPVDLLFATQLGGGTDINKALTYAEGLIQNPSETILILISDLFEGGNETDMIRRVYTFPLFPIYLIKVKILADFILSSLFSTKSYTDLVP